MEWVQSHLSNLRISYAMILSRLIDKRILQPLYQHIVGSIAAYGRTAIEGVEKKCRCYPVEIQNDLFFSIGPPYN